MEAILIVVVVAAAGLGIVWHVSRSRSLLENWAASNGYQILAYERRHFRRGPYFFRSSKGHEVFYVSLRDESGRRRNAYVRCGGWMVGLLSDSVDVEWDS